MDVSSLTKKILSIYNFYISSKIEIVIKLHRVSNNFIRIMCELKQIKNISKIEIYSCAFY